MTTRWDGAEERLLGIYDTRIVGIRHYPGRPEPPQRLRLTREPANPHDANAVRVLTGEGEAVGHLPREVVAWLAPLLDSGAGRAVAVAGEPPAESAEERPGSWPVRLLVYVGGGGSEFGSGEETSTGSGRRGRRARPAANGRPELVNSPEMEAARAWLGGVRIGEACRYQDLEVVPLFAGVPPGEGTAPGAVASGDPPRYVLLSRALAAGTAAVEEVSEAGAVPYLMVRNAGTLPVLIPEGEILVGAKQNRVVNLTVLVAAGASYRLPVSCVEAGRWRYRSRNFAAEGYAHPGLRGGKVRSAQARRAAGGEAVSDQGAVWHEVAACLDDLGADSPTASMTDGLAAARPRLADYRQRLSLPEGACGFVASTGGRMLGMDLFDAPATMAALWERLSEGYFVEAVRRSRPSRAGRREGAAPDGAAAFLAQVSQGIATAGPAGGGIGTELELAGDGLAGTGIFWAGAVCHLAAFPVAAGAD